MKRQSDRKGDIMQEKNINRFASYINISSDEFPKLRKAFTDADVDSMRRILSNNMPYASIDKLLHMEVYDGIIKEITKKVILQNKTLVPRGEKKILKSASLRPSSPDVKAQKQRVTSRRISQVQSSGTTYNRYSPVRYKGMQETFFRNHSNLSNKDLHVKYNEVFPSRSYSSIVSKKYRLKNKGKK